MHIDVTQGRISLSASKDQLIVSWPGVEGINRAHFRVNGDQARLSKILAANIQSEKFLTVAEPTLEEVPRHFRLILKGAGFELKEPGDVL